jgi:uncharacterized protein YcgI (DUF1989 family)
MKMSKVLFGREKHNEKGHIDNFMSALAPFGYSRMLDGSQA